ncbi:hypothetical protein POM88_030095 [Heracleum sosnowskyi]|uniref:Uncharacterized protein n=1 Tax=Heracleum sosnowskyi TaxID=360622 RepID=A0AAD8HWS6_9APIA|nr:hypothetical protein POM88_030095 [Heracleum sosnowskyi]
MARFCFFTIVLFILVTKGSWGCSQWNIEVITTRSRRYIQGKPEWIVTVDNYCTCPVFGIVLSCPEFETVEPVDPSLMLRSGDGRCLLILGNALGAGGFVQFSYAWDTPFVLPGVGVVHSGILSIVLSCPEFETVEPVDPSLMLRSGDGRCLLIHGNALDAGGFVQFSYAWDTPFVLPVRQIDPHGC